MQDCMCQQGRYACDSKAECEAAGLQDEETWVAAYAWQVSYTRQQQGCTAAMGSETSPQQQTLGWTEHGELMS